MVNFLKNRWLFIPICLVGLLVGAVRVGSASPPESEQTVLAVVNEDTITAEDLLLELGTLHTGQKETHRSGFDLDKILNKLINDRLLIQDARLLGLEQEANFQYRVARSQARMARAELLREAIPDTFTVSEEEIRAYYLEQYHQYHYFLLTIKERQQADSVMQLVQGGAQPEDFTQSFATELYRYGGGDKGFKRWQQLDDAIRGLVKTSQKGDIKGPFAYHNAWAIFQYLEDREADSTMLDPHRDRLRLTVENLKKQSAREAYFQQLKASYPVTVDTVLLQEINLAPDSSQMISVDNTVIATVGTSTITVKTLRYQLMHSGSLGSPEQVQVKKPAALEEIIQDSLLQKEVDQLHYQDRPIVLKKVSHYADSLLLVSYLAEVIKPQIEITSADLDSYYTANRDKFHGADEIKFSQLTLSSEDSAHQVRERLSSGADFSWIAKEWSIDEYAPLGGDRGWLKVTSFPGKMNEDLSNAKSGDVLGPYSTSDGWVLFRLNDRKPGSILPQETVSGRLRQELYQANFNRILDYTLATLKSEADVKIKRKALKKLSFSAKRN